MGEPTAALKRLIRDIPDFPKPGILFRDITPLLADPSGLALAVELLANPFRGKNIDLVVGAESRGFIFGTAVACCLSAGFVLVCRAFCPSCGHSSTGAAVSFVAPVVVRFVVVGVLSVVVAILSLVARPVVSPDWRLQPAVVSAMAAMAAASIAVDLRT